MLRLATLALLASAGPSLALESSSSRYTNISAGGDTRAAAAPAVPKASARVRHAAPLASAAPEPAPLPAPPAKAPRSSWPAALAAGAAAAAAFLLLHRRDRARRRANDESLALAAHELQSPLAAIESYLDLMASEAPAANQDARRWLEDLSRMRGTTSHLRRTITDILDMTRVEDGRVKLAARPVDLAALVAASTAAYAPHAAARGVALSSAVPAGLAPALADPDRFRQILDNLLGNAIKFTPSKRAVTVDARVEGDEVVLEIRDEGVGVPEAKRALLFGKFSRLGPAVDGTEGTGLGLYLSRRLAEAQGGRLEHEPGQSGGSVFRVTMPRA